MHPEAALQQACWVYAQQVLPPDADYASIETKLGVSDIRRAAQRRGLGIRAGEPDARLIWKGRYYGIEFKAGASLSPAQRDRHAQIEAAGAEVYVLRSVTGLARLFADLQIPLRFHALTPERRDQMLAGRRVAAKAKRAGVMALSRAADREMEE